METFDETLSTIPQAFYSSTIFPEHLHLLLLNIRDRPDFCSRISVCLYINQICDNINQCKEINKHRLRGDVWNFMFAFLDI